MDVFLQTFINAISTSLMYILFALGLTLLMSILDTLNFAHGELFMIGAYVTYFVTARWGLPYGLAFVLALPIVSLIGLVLEKTIFFPMRTRPHLDPAVTTFGATGILQAATLILFGGNAKGVPPIMGGAIHIGQLVLPLERVPLIIGALIMMFLLMVIVQRTKLGLSIRGVQQDSDAATLQGMNVNNVRTITWIIASSLAATAGVLMAPIMWIDPFMGGGLLLKAFAIIVLGGLGSVAGAIFGGFLLGFVDAFGMTYVGTYSYMFAFAIIMLVLLLRPKGLWGKR